MIKGSVPRPRDTREQRGLRLAGDRFEEIVRISPGTWSVPSCTGGHRYLVDLRSETCSCEDSIMNGGGCKHLHAATYVKAKTASCDGCGRRHRRRELVELTEDDGSALLTFFVGDLLCPSCARSHGAAW